MVLQHFSKHGVQKQTLEIYLTRETTQLHFQLKPPSRNTSKTDSNICQKNNEVNTTKSTHEESRLELDMRNPKVTTTAIQNLSH